MKPEYSQAYIAEFLRILTPRGILIFQLPGNSKPQPDSHYIASQSGSRHAEARGTVRQIKHLLKQVAPEFVFNAYVNVYGLIRWRMLPKFQKPGPIMEMYGKNREETVQLLNDCGGEILDIIENDVAGPAWESWRYCVMKGERPSVASSCSIGEKIIGQPSN